ncbi:MAG: outer membrane lipoprotein chaperone LolA [Granulosicoccus sp.]|nr:outer membrane lipoprotein chaperone LolA [Granulosicoccus sp.]
MRLAPYRMMLSAVLLLMPLLLRADDALDQLNRFIAELETFEADFEQTLYGADSEPLRSSVGSVQLKRPGRFVWSYADPQPQLIVADGERIWHYDEELQQVTVNAIDERIAGSPLKLLMWSGDLGTSFELTPLGDEDGINWIELKPKEETSDFELIFIGLDEAGLAVMELRDNFGQATQIRFSNFRSGVPLEDSVFVFEAPEGVDIIGLDEQ